LIVGCTKSGQNTKTGWFRLLCAVLTVIRHSLSTYFLLINLSHYILYTCYMIRLLTRSPKNPGSITGTRQELLFHSEGSRPILEPAQPLTHLVPWASSAGVRRSRTEAEHSDPPSAEVKNVWSYTSTLPYFFMESTGTALSVQSLWSRTHLEKLVSAQLVKNCPPIYLYR
jgi:hypothetical protein